ncbi:MAG: hypothetical protein JW982_02920 [Spirochaetes bacterium]|nr:hypothetical protein [Spirochaetota bacterium]
MKRLGIGKRSRRGRGTEIKKHVIRIIICMSAASVFSCSSGKEASADPLEDVIKIGYCTSESEVEKFYSADTVKAAEKLEEKYSGSDVLLGLDAKLFQPGMKYELLKTSVKGNTCRVDFTVTEHPDMNFAGMSITLTLKLEHGTWKIDRSKEIKGQY